MKSYKNSGFEIMGVEKSGFIKNYFSIDCFVYGNKDPPPPPKHFKYVARNRSSISFFQFVPDKDDPPPPASLLCLLLSKMSIKNLKKIASENNLVGWATLEKNLIL